ncbi:MAG: hypothetical protein K9K67_11375 [Bacteriovoracaceae bacterium]|nr:hypothetical protein [Bacteriovoracaceae bacterium]
MKLLSLIFLTLNLSAQEIPKNIKIQGQIKVPEITIDLEFELVGKSGDLAIELKASEGEAQGSCFFYVKRISAPQQTRGMGGAIFANRTPLCTYELNNKDAEKILNEVKLIDVGYRLDNNGKIYGDIKLHTLKKSYRSEFIDSK